MDTPEITGSASNRTTSVVAPVGAKSGSNSGGYKRIVYIICAADAEEGTLKSVMTDLLATKGIKTGYKSVGFGMAWTLAGAMAFFWRLFRLKGEPPITRQMLQLIGKPFTVSIYKAKRELGYSPRISWKRGIAEMDARS